MWGSHLPSQLQDPDRLELAMQACLGHATCVSSHGTLGGSFAVEVLPSGDEVPIQICQSGPATL